MSRSRQEPSVILILVAVAAVTGGLLTIAPVPLAFLPSALVLAIAAIPLLRKVELRTAVAFLISLLVIADGDYSGKAPPTVPIYMTFYTQIIPSVPSMFELITVFLFGGILVKSFGRGGDKSFKTASFRVLLLIGSILIVAPVASVLYGLATGGQFRIALWQTRSFPLFLMWAVIGFRACRSLKDAVRYLDVFVVATLVKAVLSTIFLFVYFGGSLAGKEGGEEYLVSHIASLYFGTAVVRLVIRYMFDSRGFERIWIATSLLIIFFPWVVNDRRVSFLGVAFSVVFSSLFLYRYITIRHVRLLIVAGFLVAGFVGATWDNGDHSVKSLFVKDPNEPPDYRDIENYNLYIAVGERPVLGRGYGSPFVHYMALPDIFSVVETLSWIPHNNILMIWANGGPLGLAALGVAIALSIAALVRLFNATSDPRQRTFAAVGYSVMVQWTLYFWADMALAFGASIMLPASFAGMAYKLLSLEERRAS